MKTMRRLSFAVFMVAAATANAEFHSPTVDTAKPVNMKTYLAASAAFSSVNYSGVIPFHVTFAEENDIPKAIKMIEYDYGDGTKGQDPTHIYRVPGNYKATMTTTDQTGNEFYAQFNITANIDPKECLFSSNPDKPSSYAKHYPIGNGLYLMDLHWGGKYIGRTEDKEAKEFRGFVYKPGELKGSHFSSQNLYEICREPSWRYDKD